MQKVWLLNDLEWRVLSAMTQMPPFQSGTVTKMEIDGGNSVLPRDVISSILIRLPVKSLIRFQCVCKEWKNLFKTPSFIAEHLQYSSRQNRFLIFHDVDIPNPCRVSLLDPETRALEVHTVPFIDPIRIVRMFNSCNGLFCLGNFVVSGSLSIFVWNPATREMRLVPGAVHCVDNNFNIGFVFSSTINDYRIVKICNSELRNSEIDHQVNHVEVYSLNLGTWKEVEFGSLDGAAISSSSHGLTWNGAIFWIGFKSESAVNEDEDEDKDDTGIIISFDIETEVFTLIPMPPLPFSYSYTPYRKYLTVYEDKLACLSHTISQDIKSSSIHLWVMEEGTCTSRKRCCWTKKYTSSPYAGCLLFPVTIWGNEIVCKVNLLLRLIHEIEEEDEDEEEPNSERQIVMFNFRTNEFRTIGIRNCLVGHGIFHHVESLVPVGNNHIE